MLGLTRSGPRVTSSPTRLPPLSVTLGRIVTRWPRKQRDSRQPGWTVTWFMMKDEEAVTSSMRVQWSPTTQLLRRLLSCRLVAAPITHLLAEAVVAVVEVAVVVVVVVAEGIWSFK